MSHTANDTARRSLRGRLRGNGLRVAAATVTAAAALTLTACGADDGSGTKTEGTATSTPSLEAAGHDGPAADAGTDAGKGADNSAGKDGAAGSGGTGSNGGSGGSDGGTGGNGGSTGSAGGGNGSNGAAKPKGPGLGGSQQQPPAANPEDSAPGKGAPACSVGNSRLALEPIGGTMPVITLRLTNTGGAACNAYLAPIIGYPNAQSPLAIGEKAQSVKLVPAGGSTTAVIGLGSEDGTHPHRETKLRISLQDGNGSPLPGEVTLNSPTDVGLLLDADSAVSYWGAGMDAL